MPLFLPKNLAALAGVAAKVATRYSADALRVLDQNGTYRVEATDGKKLVVIRGPNSPEKYPALPDFAGPSEVLVSVNDWRAGFKLGGKQRPVGLAADGERLVLAVGDQAITVGSVEGRFPNFDGALPKTLAPFGFRVDPLLMIDLMRAAAALDPVGGVGVLFYGADKPVGLTARNDAGQFFDGLLMPLT